MTATLEIQSIIAKAHDAGKVVVTYSVDLSAASDLLQSDTFDDVVGHRLSEGLRYVLLDFF